MDNSSENFISSNPNFTFHGNKENEVIEEMGFKFKNFERKRLPKKKMFAKRKKTETLDVEEKTRLSKSVSCDSIPSRFTVGDTENDVKNGLFADSCLKCYDPVTNYLSPRPKYLMFNLDRHREILARKEMVDRIVRSASYDCVMNLSDEELESGVCSSVNETRGIIDKSVDTGEEMGEVNDQVENVEETEEKIGEFVDIGEETGEVTEQMVDNVEETREVMDKSVDTGEETGEVYDQLIDNVEETEEFEDEKGWSLKMLLKWLVVIFVLILTTLAISSVDLPTPSPVKESIRGCMDLFSKTQSAAGSRFSEVFKAISVRNYDYEEWDKKDLVVDGDELVGMRHEQIEDVCDDVVKSKDKGSEKVENEEIDADPDDSLNKKDSGQFQESTWGLAFFSHYYEKPEASQYIEVEKNEMNIFSQMQLIDSNQNNVIEEDVEGKEDNDDNGLIENEIASVKVVKFDPVFTAFIGISLLIFASSSVLYYSMQTAISSLAETPRNEVSESNSITSFDQSTGDSVSHGSFTIEKIIVKKQKSKTPESTISKVRRSSRIHNRYVTPSP